MNQARLLGVTALCVPVAFVSVPFLGSAVAQFQGYQATLRGALQAVPFLLYGLAMPAALVVVWNRRGTPMARFATFTALFAVAWFGAAVSVWTFMHPAFVLLLVPSLWAIQLARPEPSEAPVPTV